MRLRMSYKFKKQPHVSVTHCLKFIYIVLTAQDLHANSPLHGTTAYSGFITCSGSVTAVQSHSSEGCLEIAPRR